MATQMTNNQPDIHEVILDAAEARLLHFGYHKTTMAEIAEDAGMSAANLYRYFRNKQEIVAECAARCMDERLQRLRRIVKNKKLSAAEKLQRYALELVDDSHALAGTDSRIGELVDNITRERPELIHSRNEVHYELIATLLKEGVSAGEFSTLDPEQTARTIFSTFLMFDVPLFVGLFEREEFDQRARDITALIIRGLSA